MESIREQRRTDGRKAGTGDRRLPPQDGFLRPDGMPARCTRRGALRTKRIYEPASESDGYRILVDRLWPRGVRKEEAMFDLHAVSAAPTEPLRKALRRGRIPFEEFRTRYEEELDRSAACGRFLTLVSTHLTFENVTLLTASRDGEENSSEVLRAWLERNMARLPAD